MIVLIVVSAVAGLNVGNYTFAVEDLMLNGSAYSLPLSYKKTLYFNLLAPVEVTKGCVEYNWTEILSAYTVEDVSILDMCFPVALNGSEEIGLIQKNPRAPPTGLFVNYSVHTGSPGNLNITMNCHRLSNMQAQEVGMVSYSVLWNHPAFCPRPVRQKSKFTDHLFN
ncbi:hypothetical protein BLNAU_21082 [Blattamonas nauphoetae]|uniref:Uncharacterized protein n=1 Tax=Blattamonas nauphoetae TaxID=2049346 RepID=A0ABQ9WXE8_9EUKA|nr:hypothetical protein BLNAU_21082 [Blattamonas nauphoetae]